MPSFSHRHALVSAMFILIATSAPAQRGQGHDGQRARPPEHRRTEGRAQVPAATFPLEWRTFDGSANNPLDATAGAAHVPFLRLVESDYADGTGAPAGTNRPSARAISNGIAAQTGSIPNARRASDLVWQWGQFIDHDITETPVTDPAELFPILVPTGDPLFDPAASGSATIPLTRSAYDVVDGRREQVNLLTAYIDGSMVYGIEQDRVDALRAHDGTGRLATGPGDLLPFNRTGLPNAPSTAPLFFLAGDIRANEQVGLTALHTLFVREHNHWADELRAAFPALDGGTVYQVARAVVVAEIQAITYREWLPRLIGRDALSRWRGYRPEIDAGISNVFATAAFRLGHTMLPSHLQRLDAAGQDTAGGPLALRDAFFSPATFMASGMDPILRGLATQEAQAVDPLVVDEIRNFLFGAPGSGGFDLASLNLQRGRDHGLPSYTAIREAYGMPRLRRFSDLSDDRTRNRTFAQVYGELDAIDAWIGLLAEDPARGALVGPTLQRILGEQFTRLRDGDRFWYQSYLPPEIVAFVDQQTLAVIIRRNTGIGSELQDDVFTTRR